MHKNRNIEKKYFIRIVQIFLIVIKILFVPVENTMALITAQIYESLKKGRNRISRNKQIIQTSISDYSIIEK